jgi:hypothetical protein
MPELMCPRVWVVSIQHYCSESSNFDSVCTNFENKVKCQYNDDSSLDGGNEVSSWNVMFIKYVYLNNGQCST